jgi:hypothetical protein
LTSINWKVAKEEEIMKGKMGNSLNIHKEKAEMHAKSWLETFKGNTGKGRRPVLMMILQTHFVYYVQLFQGRFEWQWFHSSRSDTKNQMQDCLHVVQYVSMPFHSLCRDHLVQSQLGAWVILPAARTNTPNIIDTQPYCYLPCYKRIFSLISLLWQNKVGLWDHIAVCVCLGIPPINFWRPEPIFVKLGM